MIDSNQIAGALRKSLDYASRVRVFRHLVPVFKDEENFDQYQFGEALGLSPVVCRVVLTRFNNEEEVENASQEDQQGEERSEATRKEGGIREDQEEAEFEFE